MEGTLYDRGIPEAGISPLKDYSPCEMPEVCHKVLDYVEKRARELSINLKSASEKGTPCHDLQQMIDEVGLSLSFEISDSDAYSSNDEFFRFTDVFFRIYSMTSGKQRERSFRRLDMHESMYLRHSQNRRFIRNVINAA